MVSLLRRVLVREGGWVDRDPDKLGLHPYNLSLDEELLLGHLELFKYSRLLCKKLIVVCVCPSTPTPCESCSCSIRTSPSPCGVRPSPDPATPPSGEGGVGTPRGEEPPPATSTDPTVRVDPSQRFRSTRRRARETGRRRPSEEPPILRLFRAKNTSRSSPRRRDSSSLAASP